MKNIKIPEAELEVMMIIWDAEKSVTSDFIMERIEKDWTKTTLLNLLSRLEKRGAVKVIKEGRHNIYSPLIKKEDYIAKESKSFLKRFYHNSLTGLVASLYDGEEISKSDLEELKKFIEEAE